MTQFWEAGLPVEVATDNKGRPVHLEWNGRHSVDGIYVSWLVDDKWWDKRVYRRYVKLTTKTGLLLILFQDQLSKNWYLHRVYE